MNFWYRYKKIIIIIGFIGIVVLLGFFLYIIFFRPAIPIQPSPGDETTGPGTTAGFPDTQLGPGQVIGPDGSQLPLGDEVVQPPLPLANEIAQGGLTVTTELNDVPSLGATLSGNGQDVQYYDQSSGKFYTLDKDGNAMLMADQVFHNVDSIVWSPKKDQAIIEYPDGANILYNFDTKTQITLPQHWKDFDFSPAGNQIVSKSIALDPKNRFLIVSNADGSKTRAIEALGTKDKTVYPSWPETNQIVAMYTEGIDFDRQEVFFVGLNNENFLSTVVEGRGFQPEWSPDGKQLLYSVYSSQTQMKPNLWIVNAHGDSIGSGRKNLNLNTWADKCTYFSNSELYCAVPKNLQPGSGLLPELANTTTDQLYKIDPTTGLKKLIAIPDSEYNMTDLMVTDNGYYLYFTDNTTKRIHKIKLK